MQLIHFGEDSAPSFGAKTSWHVGIVPTTTGLWTRRFSSMLNYSKLLKACQRSRHLILLIAHVFNGSASAQSEDAHQQEHLNEQSR